MPASFTGVEDNDQNGIIQTNGLYRAGGGNGSESVATGQYVIWRIPTHVPWGSTITSAVLTLPFGVKTGGGGVQTSNHTLYVHASTNSPILVANENMFSTRGSTGTTKSVTITYTGSTDTYSTNAFDVTAMVTELINLPLSSGGYISFYALCNSESGDMNFQLAGGGGGPRLEINYTLPAAGTANAQELWDFNLLTNGSFDTDTFGWYENAFFGGNATGGTIARDASFTFNGRPTLKYTTPAPSGTTQCGPVTGANVPGDSLVVMSGWIYIPSSVTVGVYAQFYWDFVATPLITGRNQWVPFCTPPYLASRGGKFLTISINNGFTQGQNIWLAEVGVYKATSKEMPWSFWSSTKAGQVTIGARQSIGRGVLFRRTTPKVNSKEGAPFTARKNNTLRSDGLWETSGSRSMNLAQSRATGESPAFGLVGSAVLTPNVSYAGKTWTRVTSNTANHGARINMILAELINGATYNVSVEVANDQAAAHNVSVDWVDVTSTSPSIAPGQVTRVSVSAFRATYDSTYRFMDVVLPTTGLAGSILIRDPQVYKV